MNDTDTAEGDGGEKETRPFREYMVNEAVE
jgi:hypothetical protein